MIDNLLLDAEGLHKRYGGVRALNGASLAVSAGEIHALVGENGSGKSTLLKIISGQQRPDAGTVALAGTPLTFRSPTDALRQGIATVTQETTLAPDLSVAENIFLGHRMVRRAGIVRWNATRRAAGAALRRLGVEVDPSLPVHRLRADERQMVEIARALSMDARVLILDEPTSSLTEDEVQTLYDAIREVLSEALERSDGLAASELKREKKSHMRVHGRTGEKCPVCGDVVREVSFADSSLQYCATCQTGGKPLADRRLSRLLK
jgi:ABC-type sugar transport system ATPase subunit